MTETRYTIHIRDIECCCIIGVNPDEREHKQTVLVNARLLCDLARGVASDDIEETIDYTVLNRDIQRLAEEGEFFLIETLASRIAERCLAEANIHEACITVDKPGVLSGARSVAVEVCLREPS